MRCFLFSWLSILLSPMLFAEDVFLSKEIINNNMTQQKVLSVEEELVKLHLEVEILKETLSKAEEKLKTTELDLENYKAKEKEHLLKTAKLNHYRDYIISDIFAKDVVADNEYNFAYKSFILDNLVESKKNLTMFLAKDIKLAQNYIKRASTENKNISSSIEINPLSSDKSLEQQQEKMAIDEDFVLAYNQQRDKANYMLGAISILENNPKDAILYFVDAYNGSKDPNLIIYSLIGIAEGFMLLHKTSETCLTLSKVNNTISQIKEIEPSYLLNVYNTQIIEELNVSASCPISSNLEQ